jgi:virginiamycin B lyase
VREFQIPGNTPGPEEITVGPDGALWFTEINAGIGRLDRGRFSNFPLPGRQPLGIAAGPDGAVWFTEVYGDAIGRLTTTGALTEFVLCTGAGCGEGKVEPWFITVGSDGALWFTEYARNAIGRVSTTGQITHFPLTPARGHPLGITSGPDGALWFTDAAGIGRVTTGGTVTQVSSVGASSITTGPDGNLWFAATRASTVGRMSLSGHIRYFSTSQNCSPQEIASGAGALWWGCYDVDEVDRMSTTGTLTRFPVPHHFPNYPDTIQGVVEGTDHHMWFTEYAAERIGRVSTS